MFEMWYTLYTTTKFTGRHKNPPALVKLRSPFLLMSRDADPSKSSNSTIRNARQCATKDQFQNAARRREIPEAKGSRRKNQRNRTCADDGLGPELALGFEIEEREHRGGPLAADLAPPRPRPRCGLRRLR
jgi:hypothetical protein